MSSISLAAQPRTKFGKGAARQTRRDGRVPAVLYGHGGDPVHVSLPAHDTMLALRQANALFEIDIEGESQPVLAVAKDVQRDPVRQIIEHVDLLIVKAGEKISVEVPVQVVGTPFSGSISLLEMQTLTVEADATKIPQFIEIDVEGLTDGTVITVGDVKFPAGSTGTEAPETPVVRVVEPKEETAAEEAAEGEDEAAAE